MVNAKKYVSEGKYMNAASVKEIEGKSLTIDAAFNETINDKEKLCIRFAGHDKVLALNQTNLTILIDSFGDDTDMWVNKKIKLTIVKVKFNNELKDGVQVGIAK